MDWLKMASRCLFWKLRSRCNTALLLYIPILLKYTAFRFNGFSHLPGYQICKGAGRTKAFHISGVRLPDLPCGTGFARRLCGNLELRSSLVFLVRNIHCLAAASRKTLSRNDLPLFTHRFERALPVQHLGSPSQQY